MELNALKEVWKCRDGKWVGYCPIPGLGCDRGFSVVTGFFRHYVATWFSVSRHGPQVRLTTRPERARKACTRSWDVRATKLSGSVSR